MKVSISTFLGDKSNMWTKVPKFCIEYYVFCVKVNVKDTQKSKEGQQKETRREKEGLQDDEVSNTDLKDLFSRLIKKLDELLFAQFTALEGKVDNALTGELKQINKSLQNHEDRLAKLEKQQNEVINP